MHSWLMWECHGTSKQTSNLKRLTFTFSHIADYTSTIIIIFDYTYCLLSNHTAKNAVATNIGMYMVSNIMERQSTSNHQFPNADVK